MKKRFIKIIPKGNVSNWFAHSVAILSAIFEVFAQGNNILDPLTAPNQA